MQCPVQGSSCQRVVEYGWDPSRCSLCSRKGSPGPQIAGPRGKELVGYAFFELQAQTVLPVSVKKQPFHASLDPANQQQKVLPIP